MCGDQLAREWRVAPAIEASPNGLTVAEVANWDETGTRIILPDLEALQAAGVSLYTERVQKASRWTFINAFKFKIPAPFTLIELLSFYLYKSLVRFLKTFQGFDILESISNKIRSCIPPFALVLWPEIQSVFHIGFKPSII